jgi:hypothetical protein
MTLAFDERDQLGDAAGLHAFVVGVSAYRDLPGGPGPPAPDNFEMAQLTAPARSAFRIYQWLVEREEQLPVPLATVRLLVSPRGVRKLGHIDRCRRGSGRVASPSPSVGGRACRGRSRTWSFGVCCN